MWLKLIFFNGANTLAFRSPPSGMYPLKSCISFKCSTFGRGVYVSRMMLNNLGNVKASYRDNCLENVKAFPCNLVVIFMKITLHSCCRFTFLALSIIIFFSFLQCLCAYFNVFFLMPFNFHLFGTHVKWNNLSFITFIESLSWPLVLVLEYCWCFFRYCEPSSHPLWADSPLSLCILLR